MANPTPLPTAAGPVVYWIYPPSGDVLSAKAPQRIQWSNASSSQIDILLLANVAISTANRTSDHIVDAESGFTTKVIATSVTNNGSYSWYPDDSLSLADELSPATVYAIQIVDVDTRGTSAGWPFQLTDNDKALSIETTILTTLRPTATIPATMSSGPTGVPTVTASNSTANPGGVQGSPTTFSAFLAIFIVIVIITSPAIVCCIVRYSRRPRSTKKQLQEEGTPPPPPEKELSSQELDASPQMYEKPTRDHVQEVETLERAQEKEALHGFGTVFETSRNDCSQISELGSGVRSVRSGPASVIDSTSKTRSSKSGFDSISPKPGSSSESVLHTNPSRSSLESVLALQGYI